MKTLITGANGMVARATAKYCKSIGDEVVALTREVDISDQLRSFDLFEREKFEAVINCAAYTDVDGSEKNEEKCFAGTSRALKISRTPRKKRLDFVTISTDYVFDGTKSGFYTQRDTPNPPSVYGQSKFWVKISRIAPTRVRSLCVRVGFTDTAARIF